MAQEQNFVNFARPD